MPKSRIICAIDKSDLSAAENLVSQVQENVGVIKLGLEFFTSLGPDAVKKIAKKLPVFLDLKLHDIPNTVAAATRNSASLGVSILTVHTLGGLEMLKAAAKEKGSKMKVFGVTILTSMTDEDIAQIGINSKISDEVLTLAGLAIKAGLDGIVCSPHEIEIIKKTYGNKLELIVPGIRPDGAEKGDQKRTMAPKEAIEKGADYIVIGRPISWSEDPAKASAEILKSLKSI